MPDRILNTSHQQRNKQMTPKNPRYQVSKGSNGLLYVTDKKEKTIHRHSPAEFIWGQCQYDSDTEAYPNYIHDEVWALVERR